jgi:GTP-binding protein
VFVVNKWDLAKVRLRERHKGADVPRDEDLMDEYRAYIDEELRHLDYAPIAFITAKEGKNVQTVIDLAQHLFRQANERVSTAKVNNAIRAILEEKQPSTPSGRRARIYYATQTDVAPPTIVLFVNNPDYFDTTYQRFIVNRLRDLLPYPEVPIRLLIRERVRTAEPPAGPITTIGDDIHGQTRPKSPRAKPAAAAKPRPDRTAGQRSRHSKRAPTPANAPTGNKGKSKRKH